MGAIIAFGLDRAQKAFHIAAECYAVAEAACVSVPTFYQPFALTGWRGGEVLPVTPFFDYVLVWNTGISYGLFDSLPAWALGLVMMVAVGALSVWWWRSSALLVRLGLALCIGGALSNALDRLLLAPWRTSSTSTTAPGRSTFSTSPTWPSPSGRAHAGGPCRPWSAPRSGCGLVRAITLLPESGLSGSNAL